MGSAILFVGFGCLLTLAPLQADFIKSESKRKRAPEFELTDFTAAAVRISDYKAKVVLLNFWATWCIPCKTEIPWFIEFAEKYKNDGLEVLGVSSKDGWATIKPFVDEMKINYRILLGDKRTAYLYGDIDALPVTFVIDRDQRVCRNPPRVGEEKRFGRANQETASDGEGAKLKTKDCGARGTRR